MNEQPDPSQEDTWSPARGLRRALVWGLMWAAALSVATGALACFFPPLIQNALLRAFLAFLICWVLFEVVQRSAGMAGWPCTALAVALCGGVLLSHHAVWMWHGAWTTKSGLVGGPIWFDPGVLLWLNLTALIGIGGCALIRHDGSGDLRSLVDIFSSRIGL
jgi:hypothetical protein